MANTSLWAITAKRREDFTEREKELWFGEIEYGYAPVTDKESAIKDSKTKKKCIVAWASSQSEAKIIARVMSNISNGYITAYTLMDTLF